MDSFKMNWIGSFSVAVGRSWAFRGELRTFPELIKYKNIAIYILKTTLELLNSCSTFINCILVAVKEEEKQILDNFYTSCAALIPD